MLHDLNDREIAFLRQRDFKEFSLEDACALYLIYIKNKMKLSTYIDKMRFLERNFLKLVNRYKLVIEFNQIDADTYREKVLNLTKVKYKNRVLEEVKRCFSYFETFSGYRVYAIFKMLPISVSYNDLKAKTIIVYTLEDFKKFASNIKNVYDKCLFEMLFFMGLRVGELRALKWEDINGNKLNILRTATSKLGRGFVLLDPKTRTSIRALTLPEFLINDLKRLYKIRNKKKPFIFFSRHSQWDVISESYIIKLSKKYAKLANLPYIHPHAWRHSCATFLVNALNANIYQVKEWLGHSSAQVTSKIYVHLYNQSLEDLAAKIDEQLEY